METDDLVGKVGVESHSRGETHWHVGQEAKQKGTEAGYSCCRGNETAVEIWARVSCVWGSMCRIARALLADEILAVLHTQLIGSVVTYAVSAGIGENGGLVRSVRRGGHATFGRLTLTAMMYAMVKKDVRPARTSVVNRVCLISSSCRTSQRRGTGTGSAATRRTCPEPSRRKILPKVDFPT